MLRLDVGDLVGPLDFHEARGLHGLQADRRDLRREHLVDIGQGEVRHQVAGRPGLRIGERERPARLPPAAPLERPLVQGELDAREVVGDLPPRLRAGAMVFPEAVRGASRLPPGDAGLADPARARGQGADRARAERGEEIDIGRTPAVVRPGDGAAAPLQARDEAQIVQAAQRPRGRRLAAFPAPGEERDRPLLEPPEGAQIIAQDAVPPEGGENLGHATIDAGGIGLAKTHLQQLLTDAALNVGRLAAWFAERPRAATRPSRLAFLAA